MLKPERKSPSIPTVEMLSPLEIYAVHREIFFDLPVPAPDTRTPEGRRPARAAALAVARDRGWARAAGHARGQENRG